MRMRVNDNHPSLYIYNTNTYITFIILNKCLPACIVNCKKCIYLTFAPLFFFHNNNNTWHVVCRSYDIMGSWLLSLSFQQFFIHLHVTSSWLTTETKPGLPFSPYKEYEKEKKIMTPINTCLFKFSYCIAIHSNMEKEWKGACCSGNWCELRYTSSL